MNRKYPKLLLDHFRKPSNVWAEGMARDVQVMVCGDPGGEDRITLYLDLDEDDGLVRGCWFRASGSVETIGIASWATTWVRGRLIEEIIAGLEPAARKELELPPRQWRVTKWLARLFESL